MDEQPKQVPFRCGGKAKKDVRVLADLQVCQQAKMGSNLWDLVVAGERDQCVVTDPMHIQDHMRWVSLYQDAFQKRNHPKQPLALARGWQAFGVVALLLCATLKGMAEEEPAWRVWFEAKFLAPAAHSPVAEAQGTVLAGGFWDGSQLVAFDRSQWGGLALSWGAFESAARARAAGDLAGVSVRFERNKRRVIEFAELSSDQPLVASAVLAPELGGRFSDTLGEVLLLAVPSRYRAYVFPQHGRDPSQYAGMVWAAYRETAYPVSVELFEWRNGRIKAVGVFEP